MVVCVRVNSTFYSILICTFASILKLLDLFFLVFLLLLADQISMNAAAAAMIAIKMQLALIPLDTMIASVSRVSLETGEIVQVKLAGLKNDCACALTCGKERRLKRAPIQNDCLFAGNKQAAFKSKK